MTRLQVSVKFTSLSPITLGLMCQEHFLLYFVFHPLLKKYVCIREELAGCKIEKNEGL